MATNLITKENKKKEGDYTGMRFFVFHILEARVCSGRVVCNHEDLPSMRYDVITDDGKKFGYLQDRELLCPAELNVWIEAAKEKFKVAPTEFLEKTIRSAVNVLAVYYSRVGKAIAVCELDGNGSIIPLVITGGEEVVDNIFGDVPVYRIWEASDIEGNKFMLVNNSHYTETVAKNYWWESKVPGKRFMEITVMPLTKVVLASPGFKENNNLHYCEDHNRVYYDYDSCVKCKLDIPGLNETIVPLSRAKLKMAHIV